MICLCFFCFLKWMLSVLRRCYTSQFFKLAIEMNFIVVAAKRCNLGERQIAGRQIESCSCHTHKNQILLKGLTKELFIDKLKIWFTYIKLLGTSCNWMLLLKWIRNFKVKLFKLIFKRRNIGMALECCMSSRKTVQQKCKQSTHIFVLKIRLTKRKL